LKSNLLASRWLDPIVRAPGNGPSPFGAIVTIRNTT